MKEAKKESAPGKNPPQPPREKGDDDHVGRRQERLFAGGGIVQPERLRREAEEEEDPDDCPRPDVLLSNSREAAAEKDSHQQRRRAEAQREQPERGKGVERVLHRDEADAPEECDEDERDVRYNCFQRWRKAHQIHSRNGKLLSPILRIPEEYSIFREKKDTLRALPARLQSACA